MFRPRSYARAGRAAASALCDRLRAQAWPEGGFVYNRRAIQARGWVTNSLMQTKRRRAAAPGLTGSKQAVSPGRQRLQASARLPILAWVQTVLGILATVTFAVGLPALWIVARRKGKAQQNQPSRISSAMVRYLGPAPGKDAPEVQRLAGPGPR